MFHILTKREYLLLTITTLGFGLGLVLWFEHKMEDQLTSKSNQKV